MPSVELRHGRIEFEDHGAGRPWLFLHGFPLDRTMWRGQLEALDSIGRRIAPDLRGFGASHAARVDVERDEQGRAVLSMAALADDAIELLHALSITQPVTVVALSMGGYIAWQLWHRHRSRLAGLVLCDTRAAADAPEQAAGREKLRELVLRDGPRVAAETMLPRLFGPTSRRDQAALIEATRALILAAPAETIAAASLGLARRPSFEPWLEQVDLPALVVCGSEDAISPPDEMRAFAARMPDATFVEIEGAGHMAPLERPDAFNQALTEWAARGGPA
jgi:pimeloyl-ACP methyl ester carboxylesterase